MAERFEYWLARDANGSIGLYCGKPVKGGEFFYADAGKGLSDEWLYSLSEHEFTINDLPIGHCRRVRLVLDDSPSEPY